MPGFRLLTTLLLLPVVAGLAGGQESVVTGQGSKGKPRASRTNVGDLARAAARTEYVLPAIDERRAAAAGIRKLAGKHLTLYTDLPADPAVDELPRVCDAAVPQLCNYFGVDPARVADWRIVGSVMKDKERFLGAGLYAEDLPPFPNGYSRGSELWLYDQPSDYYRRHLFLHELTHAFMNRWLGGAGPPWYMEGMAELLGTHRWADGKLQLAYTPRSKEEVPYWGRVKIVKDEYAADRGLPLEAIMRYDARAHLKTEPYGWCWAATSFLDQHPLTQAAFRELKSETKDRGGDFSTRFQARLKPHWPAIDQDWQLFVIECDYGYDVARAAVVHKPAVELPAGGATATIAADRGWQSTGYKLQPGKAYKLTASGRYSLRDKPKPWPAEAGGITIRYHEGHPLGMLEAAISNEAMPKPGATPLASPMFVGASGQVAAEAGGTLYLRINEPASGLADNAGTLSLRIEPTR